MLKAGNFTVAELENVHITIGTIVNTLESTAGSAEENTKSKIPASKNVGPTPMPGISALRNWDFRLLERYPPIYTPTEDMCTMCTFGPCNLTGNIEGACGIDMATHQAKLFLQSCLLGASAHSAHGRHLLHHLIENYGRDHPIDVGASNLKTPNIQTVTGIEPQTLGDLESVMDYVEEQITTLLATLHTGQEGAAIGFESKALHAGMIDHVGMEVSDVAQMSCYPMPKAEADTPLVDVGIGSIDTSKPVVICIGHNVAAVTYIMDYMDKHDLFDKIEIAGLCCTALDMTRYHSKANRNAKIVGTIAKELKFIRSGIPDVIVVDEQCVRADILREAEKLGMPVISTNEKIMYDLLDRSGDDVEDILRDLKEGKEPGVVLFDFDKVGELVPRLALAISPVRREKGITALPDDETFDMLVSKCTFCGACSLACPTNLTIEDAMKSAASGDIAPFESIHDLCIGCGRCEFACPKDIPILNVIDKAAQDVIKEEYGKVRVGRGQVSDPEIRAEGVNLVLGTTPGIIAMVGCSNYPDGTKDLYTIAEEMLRRNYIVVTSGCNAMDIGIHKDESGQTLYERFSPRFEKGGFLNVGSCVSNSHITGAAIKVAAIFAGRNITGNYEEIADYVLNRVGAVGIAWGAYSQKAASIGTGCNRLGVPVIVGPHGGKYRRALIGRPYDTDKWTVLDSRNGESMPIPPVPEFMITTAETVGEVLPMLAKNCIRPSDNSMGRMIKLTHYIELCEKYLGKMPDDWHVFVRSEADLPLAKREPLLRILEKEHGWEIDWKRKKIIKGPLMKVDVSAQPTNVPRLCKEDAK